MPIPTQTNTTDSDQDEPLQRSVDSALRVATLDSKPSRTFLDKLEIGAETISSSIAYETAQGFYAGNAPQIKKTTKAIAEVAKANLNIDIKSIESSIRGFAESSKVLMSALDEVAKLHPFIGVALLAFKAVVTLELKRRENDKKVIILSIEMKDMMSVLLQLRYVKDPLETGPDGKTVQGRMQALLSTIAEDITACGNTCDTYSKKRVLVWQGKLAQFSTIFAEHRKEITFALSIHTTIGVDNANRTLAILKEGMHNVDEKLDVLLLFKRLESPREKELMKLVKAKGGPEVCMNDEEALKELATLANVKSQATADGAGSTPRTGPRPSDGTDAAALTKLKTQLKEDVSDDLKANMDLFEKKLEVQKRQLVLELQHVVQREGDRVISVIVSGPHDRIIDPDLHNIWKEMAWKGSVKARHFVLALHDYFLDKYLVSEHADAIATSNIASPVSPSLSAVPLDDPDEFGASLNTALATTSRRKRDSDRWALVYINVLRVQSVLEAFDDDGSGFVSVKEANTFSTSRPRGWSLPHWIAYWAAGWHSSIVEYRFKIKQIITHMFAAARNVLRINKSTINAYMCQWSLSLVEHRLLRSVRPYVGEASDVILEEKIRPFVQEEEKRLEANLASVAYNIDGPDTLSLITGPGRIERYLFPLLYVLLRRHLQVIELASKVVIFDNELDNAIRSLEQIQSAIYERIHSLTVIFKPKGLDVTEQLSHVACGMFQLWHNPSYPYAWEFSWADDDLDSAESESPSSLVLSLSSERYSVERTGPDEIETVGESNFLIEEEPGADGQDGVPEIQVVVDDGSGFITQVDTGVDDPGYESGRHSYRKKLQTDNGEEVDISALTLGVQSAELELTGYDVPSQEVADPEDSTDITISGFPRMAGGWTGVYWFSDDTGTTEGVLRMNVEEEQDGQFHGIGEDGLSLFTLRGRVEHPAGLEGTHGTVTFKKWSDILVNGLREIWYYTGVLDVVADTITGEWTPGDENPSCSGTCRLSRAPVFVYRFRYTDEELAVNPVAARWAFARAAVLHLVRKKHFTLPYIVDKFAERRRFVDLFSRRRLAENWYLPHGQMKDGELEELQRLECSLAPADVRFYRSVAIPASRSLCIHHGISCDGCSTVMIGSRVTCIECIAEDWTNQIDLCPYCIDDNVSTDAFKHTPSHPLVKFYDVLFQRNIATFIERARSGVERAQTLLQSGGSDPPASCIGCKEPVAAPCWFCVDCDTKVAFLCDPCETAKREEDGHKATDVLVRCLPPAESPASLDQRMSRLEERFAASQRDMGAHFEVIETRLKVLGDRFTVLEGGVETRLANLELLMQQLVSKIMA